MLASCGFPYLFFDCRIMLLFNGMPLVERTGNNYNTFRFYCFLFLFVDLCSDLNPWTFWWFHLEYCAFCHACIIIMCVCVSKKQQNVCGSVYVEKIVQNKSLFGKFARKSIEFKPIRKSSCCVWNTFTAIKLKYERAAGWRTALNHAISTTIILIALSSWTD